MPRRDTLRFINGEDAVARLDSQRVLRAEHADQLHGERTRILGGMASEGDIVVPPEVAHEIQARAQASTGEIPVARDI